VPPSDSGTDGTPSEEESSDEEYWREVLLSLRKKAAVKKKAELGGEPAPESPPVVGPLVEDPGPVAVVAASGSDLAGAVVGPSVEDPGPVAVVRAPRSDLLAPRVERAGNDVFLRGRLVKKLFNNSTGERIWSGYSWKCLACGVWKDLHFVASGMDSEEALDRLQVWESRCRANHKLYGGPLLRLCAS
jgi:hypothetical protein